MNSSINRRTFFGLSSSLLTAPIMCRAVLADAVGSGGTQSELNAKELLDYDALGLAQLIKKREISAKELCDVTLYRIEKLDGKINAMTRVLSERALNRALLIAKSSLFGGVPTLLKDMIDLAGVPRTNGSKFQLTPTAQKSPDYVKALEAAGLNIVGMTNVPEFASLPTTDNHAFGPCLNPWDLTRTAGASSGGAAAAVAAGYVQIAHGTDGGGSNRLPASCCGLLGMKASRYRMASGELDGSHDLFRTHQSISRSVRDSAALAAVTENLGPDNRYPPMGWVSGPEKRRLTIAASCKNVYGSEPSAAVKAAWEDAVTLCTELGHRIVEVDNSVVGESFFSAYEAISFNAMPQLLAAVEHHTGIPAEESGLLTPMVVSIGRAAAQLPKDAYVKGLSYIKTLQAKFDAFYQRYDLWLTPVSIMEAPKIDLFSPNQAYQNMRRRLFEYAGYTPIANMIGAPAMSVPLYWTPDTNLPIGTHFMAKPGNDKLLYQLAYELEAARPWNNRWAPHSAKFLN